MYIENNSISKGKKDCIVMMVNQVNPSQSISLTDSRFSKTKKNLKMHNSETKTNLIYDFSILAF